MSAARGPTPERMIADAFAEADAGLEETWKDLKGCKADFNEVVDSWITEIASQRKKLRAEKAKLERKLAAAGAKAQRSRP